MNTEDICKKQYAEMQDGETVVVYDYRYTGTVNVWTENGIVNSGLAEVTVVTCKDVKISHNPTHYSE